jgi:hypothetical protein
MLNGRVSERVHFRTVEAVVLSRKALRILKRQQEAFRGREKLFVISRALLEADSVLV